MLKMCDTFSRIFLLAGYVQFTVTQYTFTNVKLEAYASRTSDSDTVFLSRESRIPKSLGNNVAISIENQRIPKVFAFSFVDLPHLAYLQLVSNEMAHIEQGAFQKLPSLYLLDLSKNKLTRLQDGVLNHLSISDLILSHNRIEDADVNAFDHLPHLRYLDISRNNLKRVNANWFKNTPKLVEVRLDFNHIVELPERAFQNLKTLPQEHYYSAKYPTIRITNNRISSVHPNAFGGLEEIWQLRLDHNNITVIGNDVFGNVYKVHHLNISYNQITCLSDAVLQRIKRTVALDIAGNNMRNDCVKKVLEWSKETDIQVNL